MIPPKGKSTKKAAKGRGRGRKPRGFGEGSLLFPYIRRLKPILGGSNFEFQYFGFFFRKINTFFFFLGGGG